MFAHHDRPAIGGSAFWRCISCYLDNGDKCCLEDFVIAADGQDFIVGRVEEILQKEYCSSGDPDAILLRAYDTVERLGPRGNPYDMPYLIRTNRYVLGTSKVTPASELPAVFLLTGS